MITYCIFSANYPPHVGGVDRYSQKIAQELATRGNRVIVITSSIEGQREYEHINENMEIIRLPSLWFLGDRMPVLRQTKKWREVRQMLSNLENPRIIIQTFLYPLSYAAARLARQKKWPFIVINHGCNYVCQGNGLIDKAEHLYEEFLARAVTWKSNGCYAVSQAAGEWARHFNISFTGVLSNAIDTHETIEKLKTLSDGFRAAYGLLPETMVVGYVGRLIPEKGILQTVKAVQQLLEEGRDVALIAAGDGPLLDRLKCNVIKRIIFLGNAEHDDVLRLLRECDCCCLPSDSEGFPTVLLEAALCRSYLIGSPYGGTPELIGDSRYGTVLQGNTQKDIYEALLALLEGKIDKEKIVENAYKRVIELFSWQSTCNRIEMLPWNIAH